MSLTKRELLAGIAASTAALSALPRMAQAQERSAPPTHDMSAFPAHWYGKEQIAFLAYPSFTALDLVGPHYMLSGLLGATVHIVAKSREPVTSDQNLTLTPTASFEDCPKDLDIICVPGGTQGTLAAMRDPEMLAFLGDRGARARHVTSVCTGSLLLGAAGLLKGYKATSHWIARETLVEFGATPVDARVVVDRNRITGAGVTAGLDFGLILAARLRDEEYGKALQLVAEYQPEPPFSAGTPQGAGPRLTGMMEQMFVGFLADVRATARAAKN